MTGAKRRDRPPPLPTSKRTTGTREPDPGPTVGRSRRPGSSGGRPDPFVCHSRPGGGGGSSVTGKFPLRVRCPGLPFRVELSVFDSVSPLQCPRVPTLPWTTPRAGPGNKTSTPSYSRSFPFRPGPSNGGCETLSPHPLPGSPGPSFGLVLPNVCCFIWSLLFESSCR